MTEKRIVDISEIEKLFNRFTTPTHRLETIMQYIDQATPVSGLEEKLKAAEVDAKRYRKLQSFVGKPMAGVAVTYFAGVDFHTAQTAEELNQVIDEARKA